MQYANLDKLQEQMPNQVDWQHKKNNPKKTKRIIFFIVLFLLVSTIYTFSPLLLRFAKLFIASPRIIYSVVANKEPNLKATNGRTNILLLGTGGGVHDGPDLTDTIIVASIDDKSGDTVLFSLPRDVYISETQSKINAVYAEAKPKGQALQKAMDIIGSKVGLPIHYGVRVDFAGFRKAIDLVGGINVTVENTFDDYAYPLEGKERDTCGFTEVREPLPQTAEQQASALATASAKPLTHIVYLNQATGKRIPEEEVSERNNPYACRFEHIHFEKGPMYMDGTTALKFVRSRHALGVEGSDFARSKRQQLVVQAFRSQVTSKETLLDLSKIQGLVNTFGETIDTNITEAEYGDFFLLYKRIKQTPLRSFALTDGSDGGEPVFVNPPMAEYGGAWVLIPKGNDWNIVHQAVQKALILPTPTPLPSGSLVVSPTPASKTKPAFR